MRLIDADVLTERLNNAIECGRRVDMPTLELEAVLVNVQNAPSIDIVRCRECEHGTWHEQTEMYICSANDQDLYEAEHFCSYGERREP